MLKVNAFNTAAVLTEETWNLLKTALLDTTNGTCGKMKKHHQKRVTWWWKAWKQGGSKEQYLQAKRNAKCTQQRRLLK